MKLTQKELVRILDILKRVPFGYPESKEINLIIEKLHSFVKPEAVVKVPMEVIK